jgi:hypothetical protein
MGGQIGPIENRTLPSLPAPSPPPHHFSSSFINYKIDNRNTKMLIISFCSDNVAQVWYKRKRVIKG